MPPVLAPVPVKVNTEYFVTPRRSGVYFISEDTLHELKVETKQAHRRRRVETESRDQFMELLADIATDSENMDSESKLHEIRCLYMAKYLADLLGIDPESRLYKYFLIGALYHDEGKEADKIKHRIRIKGLLSDDDRKVTHLHPLLGTLRALMNGLDPAAEYALTHHAFYNREVGHMKGYPDFVSNPELIGIVYGNPDDETFESMAVHLGFTLADQAQYIFLKELLKAIDECDALCSRRIYRDRRLTKEEMETHLINNNGIRFNPEVVALIVNNIDEIRFFHYLMYRTHNHMISEMNLPQHWTFIDAPVEYERSFGGEISARATSPLRVSWTEMSAANIHQVMEQTNLLYNDFVTTTRPKYRTRRPVQKP